MNILYFLHLYKYGVLTENCSLSTTLIDSINIG